MKRKRERPQASQDMMNYAKAKRSPWEAERQAQENGTLTVQPQVINYSNQLIKGNRSSNMSKVITELYADQAIYYSVVFVCKKGSNLLRTHAAHLHWTQNDISSSDE